MNIDKSIWYHIVLCWDNTSGVLQLFKDGTLVYSDNKEVGAVIKSGGILMLGQVRSSIKVNNLLFVSDKFGKNSQIFLYQSNTICQC